ncbi:MAG TPA: FkbM family methyltransferase [Acidimicrobiales bacterium]|nr:FkbM family methyltransferase [Acidimicrobiales bacterium]
MARMVSYAQNAEDVLLDRLFARGLKGFYIDVGAMDPVHNSVTKHFYDLGWRGINVEPAEEPFRRLREVRTRDVNLGVGVSDEAGTLTFYEAPPDTGDSTFSAEHAARHRASGVVFSERSVPVVTLAQVCEDHVEDEIDFVSVDVEGHEDRVVAGADWKRWRPRVVLIEATEPGTTVPSHDRWEPTLLEADYLFAAFDGLNRYYVRAEDAQLLDALRTPVNVFDDYEPFRYVQPLQELRQGYETSQRHLVAARAFNETLWHEYNDLLQEHAELEPELSMLQAEFERLYRSLANTRAHYEALNTAIEAAQSQYEPLARAAGEVRAQAEAIHALFEGISPGGLGVARRLTRLSGRFPGAAKTVTRTARIALAARRKLSQVGGG